MPLSSRLIGSKLRGLKILERLHVKQGSMWRLMRKPAPAFSVLPHRVYRTAGEFSIRHFTQPKKGRLLIRTDPVYASELQSEREHQSMPRTIIELEGKNPAESEETARKWMETVLQEYKKTKLNKIRFIVHKIPAIKKYDRRIKINIDLEKGTIAIQSGKAEESSNMFRLSLPGTNYHFADFDVETLKIKDDAKISKGRDNVEFPEILFRNICKALNPLLLRIRETNPNMKSFELSAVTYNNDPHHPEFYDLLIGK